MKRNYQSGAKKKQAKRRKIAEAARNSQRLSLWLTRPETFKADEQDVNIHETENFDTTKDRSDAIKNDDFPTIIVNSEIKKAVIAAGPKQPKELFPKNLLQSSCSFSINYYHFVTQSGVKLQDNGYVIHQASTVFTASPAGYFLVKMSFQRFLTHFKTLSAQQV